MEMEEGTHREVGMEMKEGNHWEVGMEMEDTSQLVEPINLAELSKVLMVFRGQGEVERTYVKLRIGQRRPFGDYTEDKESNGCTVKSRFKRPPIEEKPRFKRVKLPDGLFSFYKTSI